MTRTVIFDWDGTLADTKNVVIESFQSVLRKVDCHVNGEFIARLIGVGSRKTFQETLKASGISYDEELLRELIRNKVQIEIELSDKVKLFDGAVDLLKALQGNCRMALASMNNREVIDDLLNKRGLVKYFEVVVTADEVTNPKPDPEVFLKCAKKLSASSQQCVVIEDSIFGVRAAKKAGMKCIAVLTGSYGREELEKEHPDLIVNGLTEKTRILDFIFN